MTDIVNQIGTFEAQVINYRAYNLGYLTVMRSIQATQMRGKPSCVVLEAPSGCGKTTLANQIIDAYAPVCREADAKGTGINRPTLYCGLPPKATINTFAKAMLKSLEFEAYSGDSWELTERVIAQIKIQKVEVVFLDEIQMLSDKQADQAKKDVMDCITRLVDRTGIPFVALGTEGIKEFFEKKVLARRFPFFAKLAPLEFDHNPDSDWQMVLSGLDRKLYEIGSLTQGVHLHEPHIAAPLFAACGGVLEDLRMHLSNAFTFALLRQDRVFRLNDLVDAFDITEHANSVTEGNPFHLSKKVLLAKIKK